MKIGIIIFNLTIIIFIIFLIYLYIYINYKNENFMAQAEDQGDITASTIQDNALINKTWYSEIKIQSDLIDNSYDGSDPKFAYPSRIIPGLKKNFELIKFALPNNSALRTATFPDGYYWIKFDDGGAKYIYCIMNEAYYGGGWMLAMRGVRNSRTFNYDSSFWTDTRTLNDDFDTILNTLKRPEILNTSQNISHTTLKQNMDLQIISSLGKGIYSNNLDPNIFDLKTSAFNSYNAKEWMAIFYYTDGNGESRGGDIIDEENGGVITNATGSTPISSARSNTRGWIWKETPYSSAPNNAVQPAQKLFSDRSSTGGRFNRHNNNISFLPRYNIDHAKDLDKMNKRVTGTHLWSCQYGFNFYGINWEKPGTSWAPENFKVRWGFIWNNEGHEIYTSDAACGIGMSDYSCRDHYKWGGTEVKGCNSSIAFEFYVR